MLLPSSGSNKLIQSVAVISIQKKKTDAISLESLMEYHQPYSTGPPLKFLPSHDRYFKQ